MIATALAQFSLPSDDWAAWQGTEPSLGHSGIEELRGELARSGTTFNLREEVVIEHWAPLNEESADIAHVGEQKSYGPSGGIPNIGKFDPAPPPHRRPRTPDPACHVIVQ